ncbi:MAG: elongation factor P [Acidobacteria bacterium]|nr:MAG: elongation factor P [Acidobacteriota bacterium]PIE91325.1 MAG: elongation factor P [Acidobacteriota bacterium]
MISISDFKKGVRFESDGAPWQTMELTVHNPSARGAATLVKVKARNLLTGQVLLKTFKSGEMFEEPELKKTEVSFLYDQGDEIVVMDEENYDQYHIPKDKVETALPWMSDGFLFSLLWYKGEIIQIDLPDSIEVQVSTVEGGAKGDTASGKVLSKAILENGLEIQVPTYVKESSRIKVNPNTRTFLSRA